MIIDCAVYEAGARREGSLPLSEALETSRASSDGFVWIDLHEPEESELAAMAAEFEFHPLAVEDALHPHERPKLELYGSTLFVVLKAARYVDPVEVVELSQIMVFLGESFLVTVSHGKDEVLVDIRRQAEADPRRLRWGPISVLHAVIDRVVDDYDAVLWGLDGDIEEIEREVFSDDRLNHAERIYKLKREVLEFRQAVVPLTAPIETLATGRLTQAEPTILNYFRDVQDHLLRVAERIEAIDALLTSALSANLAQVGVRQNEDMRRISAWVAIIAMPTMIAGIYGMNFDHMPELTWVAGYPLVLAVMALACVTVYILFRRRGWL